MSAGRVRLPDPWLPAWCPRWCDWDHDHTEWAYEDRRHRSADLDVVLSAMDMIADEAEGEVSFTPRRLSASLEAHYRETEPRVCIAHGDEPEAVVYATLDEAEEHARHLLSLVTRARGAQEAEAVKLLSREKVCRTMTGIASACWLSMPTQ